VSRRDEGVERDDRRLLAVLDAGFARAAEAAGAHLACRPGCSECCLGPFPVTLLDARRLGGGMRRLRRSAPGTAAAVERRARAAVAALTPAFPGDPATGRLDEDETRLDAFFERHATLACPALDPLSGRCELYAERPVACRTHGPPLRYGEEAAPHCRLCFRDADAEIVERCRFEPDPEGIEDVLLDRLGAQAGGEWETLIAFVLAGYL